MWTSIGEYHFDVDIVYFVVEDMKKVERYLVECEFCCLRHIMLFGSITMSARDLLRIRIASCSE